MDIEYLCENCNSVFDIDDVIDDYDYNTNYHDTKCPCCGSRFFEEARQCEVCGEYVVKDELVDGICESCLDDCDIDDAVEIGEILAHDFQCVNPFLEEVLGYQAINSILKKAYNDIIMQKDFKIAKEFIKDPKYVEASTYYLKNRGGK